MPLNTVCWLDTLPAQLAKALNIISCSFLTPLPVRALWQESVEPPAPHLKMPSGGVFAASRKHLVLTRARTRENRCNHGDAYNIILIRSGNLSWGLSLLHTRSCEHIKRMTNWKLALSRLLALRSQASKEIWASGKRWYSTGINRVDAEIWYLVTVHIEKFGIWELDTRQLKNLEFRNVGIRGYRNQKICAANSSYQRSSHRLVDSSIHRFIEYRFSDSTIQRFVDPLMRGFVDSLIHGFID